MRGFSIIIIIIMTFLNVIVISRQLNSFYYFQNLLEVLEINKLLYHIWQHWFATDITIHVKDIYYRIIIDKASVYLCIIKRPALLSSGNSLCWHSGILIKDFFEKEYANICFHKELFVYFLNKISFVIIEISLV